MGARTPREQYSGPGVDPFLWREAEASGPVVDLVRTWAKGRTAADVGAGTGVLSVALANVGFDVTAIDTEEVTANHARVRSMRAEVPPLPIPDASVDTLLMLSILEHVDEEDQLLAEARRVVRKRLILLVPSDDDGELPGYGLCLVHHIDKTHRREYNPESIRTTLERHGFRLVHLEPVVPRIAPLVVATFFRGSVAGRMFRRLTLEWIKLLQRFGVIDVAIAGDWFAVAEPMSEP